MIKKIILAAACTLSLLGCGDKQGEQANTQAADQQTYHWKMVTTWPKNFPGLGTSPEKFAQIVDEMTDGQLKIKVYGAGDLVPALEVFDAVSQGSVEMGHGASYYWKGKVPASQFFTAIPFGLNAQEMNSWLHYGGGIELWREAYEPFNVVPLAGGNTGVQMAGWFNKEIKTVDDLTGLKMRIPGLGGEVLTRLGGTAVNIPGGELYTSLQTGVIDATEWVGPWNDLAFGFYQVSQYYYYPGWHETGSTLEIIINKDALEALPPRLQKIVEVAARAINQDMLDEYTAKNNDALNTLIDTHGVKVRKLPDDVLQQLHKASLEVLEELAQSDQMSHKTYESIKRFSDNVKNYHRYSEQAYYEARDLEIIE